MNTYPPNTYPAQRPPTEAHSSPGLVTDLAAYYHLLREKAWVIITCVLVAVALGGAYVIRSPKIYAASAVVLVNQSEDKVVNIQEISTEDLASPSS